MIVIAIDVLLVGRVSGQGSVAVHYVHSCIQKGYEGAVGPTLNICMCQMPQFHRKE